MKKSKLMLVAILLFVVAMILPSCAAPTPTTIEKVVEKVVTQVVEKQVVQTQVVETVKEVEKQVIQTQVVEKQVEVQVHPDRRPGQPLPPRRSLSWPTSLKDATKEQAAPGRRQVRPADQRRRPVLDRRADRRVPRLG